jgi:Rieske Fe-S protein
MFAGNVWILLRAWLAKTPAYPLQIVATLGEVPLGGVKLFTYPTASERCILIRTAADSFAAYSQKCTHLSCAVYYQAAQQRLACPCHQGYFSVKDGSVLQGPPPRPLPRVLLQRRGQDLVAVGIAGAAEG